MLLPDVLPNVLTVNAVLIFVCWCFWSVIEFSLLNWFEFRYNFFVCFDKLELYNCKVIIIIIK